MMTSPLLFDAAALRNAFCQANLIASKCAQQKGILLSDEQHTCRYCGRRWQRWAGSSLDGHAACIVTEDFKKRVKRLLVSSPAITYASLAAAIGVTPSVVRSWTRPIR